MRTIAGEHPLCVLIYMNFYIFHICFIAFILLCGGVSMAGGREGQGARKGNRVRGYRLPSLPCFVQNLLKYFGFLSR